MRRYLRRPDLVLAAMLFIGMLTGLGTRLIYYSSLNLGDSVQHTLERVLSFQTFLTVLTLIVVPLLLGTLLLLIPLFLIKPRWFIGRDSHRWHTRPWLFVVLWVVAAAAQGFFDINPRIAAISFLSLP